MNRGLGPGDEPEASGNGFAVVAGPLLARARDRLAARLREICDAGHGSPLYDPGLLAAELTHRCLT